MSGNKTTYGNLRKGESGWILEDIAPHVALRLKQIFPKIPEYATSPFKLPANDDTAADLVWFTQRYPLAMSPSIRSHLSRCRRRYLAEQAQSEAILAPEYTPNTRAGLKIGQNLRSYQGTAVDFVEHNQAVLVLDEIGLGKSYIGLAISLIGTARPAVIVCEPHLHDQWEEKGNTFLDARICKVEGTTPYSLPDADIYLFKYTQLSPWVDVLTNGWVKSITFDEIQQLRRGAESSKGRAAIAICDKVPIKVGLTASLIYNYGIETWHVANIIRPGILGTKAEFIREWCDENNEKGIVKDPDALGAYLREQSFIIRRTKSDVGQEARQLTPHVEWVTPNTNHVEDHQKLLQQLAIKTFSSDFQEAGQASLEFDIRMRQLTGLAKASAVAAYVRMFAQAGTPVLLFGYHRDVYSIWLRELADLNPLLYTGSETTKQKQRNKKAFIDGETNILIMSLRSGAGADGLQHRCSTVIFGEFDWSSEIHRQCIGRLDRDGQRNEVWAFFVATQYGSDPQMLDTLSIKTNQARGIRDPYGNQSNQTPAAIAQQTSSDRIRQMAKHYLETNGINVPGSEEWLPDELTNEELVALL